MHAYLFLLCCFCLDCKAGTVEEEQIWDLEFVFLMWQNPTQFEAVDTPFTQ